MPTRKSQSTTAATPSAVLTRPRLPWAVGVLYVLSLVVLAYFAVNGWDYYTTPLIERPRHELYWALKPGGELGRVFGIVGTALMLLMLSYSVRRRWKALAGIGNLATWLDFHIFCGIIGPLFVVLHSSFKVTGLVALSFWSMVLVAASGVVGRFLYQQIPRRRSGDELSLAEVEARRQRAKLSLSRDFGVTIIHLQRIEEVALAGVDSQAGLLKALLTMPVATSIVRLRIRHLARQFPSVNKSQLGRLLEEQALLSMRVSMWKRTHELFHYWHVLHRPFALVMYLFAAVHIIVATVTGYGFN